MLEPTGPNLCHCFANRRSGRALTRLYDRHLAPIRITISQFSILSLLEKNPKIRIVDLADLMIMERTTLVRALKPLQRLGYVVSEPAERGRALVFSASVDGIRKVAEAIPLWLAAQQEFEQTFGRDRASRLRQDNLDFALQG